MLAVPWVALLWHCRRADLCACEILEDLTDFASLQVSEVVCKVCDDSECDIHLQEETENMLRLNELV